MRLTRSQHVLLDHISRRSGAVNWYQLGRACLGHLDSPADFELRSLLDANLIQERPHGDEPLGRLWLTEAGAVALAENPVGQADA